ncbi:MAG: TatD family hydrolase, partial [Bacteroidota bacterium]
VERIYLPNIDGASIDKMLLLEDQYPGYFFPMMGLHPCSVDKEYEQSLRAVREWLEKRPFCAVGEIGLDLHWDVTHLREQQEAFLQQVEWAVEFDLPFVIHSRKATDLIIEMLQVDQLNGMRGIFHCFGGSVEQAEAIIELGFYLGIGGVLTYKNSGLDKTLKHISLEHIVLETDAPYLAPVPYRGKRNESSYIAKVADKLAEVKDVSIGEVERLTSENALKVFGAK